MSETILVADNEPDILRFIEVNLQLEGFEVLLARDGAEALAKAQATRPALILLDVMMPRMDGFEVCRRLREDARTSHIPVIILTAKSMTVDKVVGLTAGADDYVLKPFDPTELVARVRTTLRRASDLRATSPLTGLPGNHRISQELHRRLQHGGPLAVVHADLNDFKAYNDRYGFLRGDEVIKLTADILQEATRDVAGPGGFVGHIGGDDFMLVCGPADIPPVCEQIITQFDSRLRAHYDPEDLDRSHIEVPDRRGEVRKFPLITIALGAASNERRSFTDHRELVEVATEMKSYLKQHHRRSAYAIDGRASDPPAQ